MGVSQRQAFNFLLPYLRKLYQKEKINRKKEEIQFIFNKYQKEIFLRIEIVTGKKIYRRSFTCFLTTFPRAAYDYERGYIWLPIIWPKETHIRTFIHELLHFQTYAYWEKQYLGIVAKREFEDLKESLTVISNEEFLDLIVWPDKGYKIHDNLRKRLLSFWKKNKDFNKLVKFSISLF